MEPDLPAAALRQLFAPELFKQPERAVPAVQQVLGAANAVAALRPRAVSLLCAAALPHPVSAAGLLLLRAVLAGLRVWRLDSVTPPPLLACAELWAGALPQAAASGAALAPFAEALAELVAAVAQAPTVLAAGRLALQLGAPVLFCAAALPALFAGSVYRALLDALAARLEEEAASRVEQRVHAAAQDLLALAAGHCGALPALLAGDLLGALRGAETGTAPALAPHKELFFAAQLFRPGADSRLDTALARLYARNVAQLEVPRGLAPPHFGLRRDGTPTPALSHSRSFVLEAPELTGAEAAFSAVLLG